MADYDLSTPKYRVIGDRGVDVGVGVVALPNQEFESKGWPKSVHLKPLNLAAERTFAYWRANHMMPGLPQSPWSTKYSRFLLLEIGGADAIRPLPADRVTPEMPVYRAIRNVDENWRVPRLFATPPTEGDRVTILVWPGRLLDEGFVADNDAADAIVRYAEKAQEHPFLEKSPFDHFRMEVFLPALPEVDHWGRKFADVPAWPGAEWPKPGDLGSWPASRGRSGGRVRRGARRPVAA